ncbi:MAG: class I SAM-dependent methyltransferase [Planctomycetes bacterium]|nr:class I SAM-dependent methyltransferase [Planctomycetota bacterium]
MAATSKEAVIGNYKTATVEEGRFEIDFASGFEPYMTKKYLDKHIAATSEVIEIGCGTGYYGLYLADKCRTYLGVDIAPANIELFAKKIDDAKLDNVKAIVGDATDLNFAEDGSYDVVLALGPMYHLPEKERELVVEESSRICKKDGVIFYAYLNKIGAYLSACVLVPDNYPNPDTTELVMREGRDDILPDVFFYSTPEDMEALAQKHGLAIIVNIGTSCRLVHPAYNSCPEPRRKEWQYL